MRKHNHDGFTLLTVLLMLALAPGIAAGQHRERNGQTTSDVTDAGMKPVSVEMNAVTTEGDGAVIGTIRARQLAHGILFEPALKGLEPGLHGFHVHENGNCYPAPYEEKTGATAKVIPAGEAGDHWDPGAKGNHEGPWGRGHLGDLPNLHVEPDGVAFLPVYAPRLTLKDLQGRALVIHAERDSYEGGPDGTGGSGSAVACGVWRE